MVGGWAEWMLGFSDQALASITEGLALASRLGHPFSFATSRLHAAILHHFRREPEEVLRRIGEAEVAAAEQRLAVPMDTDIMRGAAFTLQGSLAAVLIGEGISRTQRVAAKLYRTYCLAILAEACLRSGDHARALATLAEALSTADQTAERWWIAEIHRIRGECLLAEGSLSECERSFEQAIRIARRQQAKSLELRAATSLARLCGEQGRRAEARDLLAPVYGWFTEGFSTADLKKRGGCSLS